MENVEIYAAVDLEGSVDLGHYDPEYVRGKLVLTDHHLWEVLDIHQKDFLATKCSLFVWDPKSSWESFLQFQRDFPNHPVVCFGSSDLYEKIFARVSPHRVIIRYWLRKSFPYSIAFRYPRHRYLLETEIVEPGEFIHKVYVRGTSIQNEIAYITALQDVLANGRVRRDRTGTGTISMFGPHMEFDLRKGFPLLTTKKMFWKGVVEELLMFLRGETQTKCLESKGVGIWKGNTSREFQDRVGLGHLQEGDMGKMYGYQWRLFNGKVDQLSTLVREIKKNPESRRLFVTAWNPCQLQDGVLPPCHVSFQVYIDPDSKEMDLHMYQRSADMFLGVPFNIASYGLLLSILAKVCGGYVPRKLFISIGDAHIYSNHVSQVKQMIGRVPINPPVVTIDDCSFDTITEKHIHLINYESHDPIRAEMAV